MFGMGHWEILIILLVVLLVFGAKRIPEMAHGLGKGIKEFRKAMREVQDEIDTKEPAQKPNSIGAPPPPQSVAQNSSSSSEQAPSQTQPSPEKKEAETSRPS